MVVYTLLPSAPFIPGADGGLTVSDIDPRFRRNERLYAWVAATQPFNTAQLSFGVSSGRGTPATQVDAGLCTFTPCNAAGCACFELDLWRPVMPSFRERFTVNAAVSSSSVDVSAPDGGFIPVTRFVWSRRLTTAAANFRASPALDREGRVFIGNGALGVGPTFWAVDPTGQVAWSTRDFGTVRASPALSLGGTVQPQWLFVASNEDQGSGNFLGAMRAVLPSDGGLVHRCGYSSSDDVQATPAIVSYQGVVGAASFSRNAHNLLSIRPSQARECDFQGEAQDMRAPMNLVAQGDGLYGVDTDGWLLGWRQSLPGINLGWAPTYAGVEQIDARSLAAWGPAPRLVASGSNANSAGQGMLVQHDALAGGAILNASFVGAVGGPVILSDGGVLVGGQRGLHLASGTTSVTVTTLADAGAISTTPVLGTNDLAYALRDDGTLVEFSLAPTLRALWGHPLTSTAIGVQFEGSPVLDCTRHPTTRQPLPGRPAVLYAVSQTGTLYAVVVDARGIDSTAWWPMYGRDPRHSGNLDTSLSEFRCP